ncbi:hypothetical protein PPL_11446 [Heterostelium album PN500]|uniref:O-methyltransferase domain-containing protein n=1 Tax=Heterostelium pallidum (strain ATCC 26659 / Pp 5 / PN500) TaxID=670386 RepID=D3BTF2_HETP5|nr:hypothetical protein PPL_11446 [Heterostelium album PN500]EFA75369.1 hypothetical protein PPL_11446 [Heterostelium album PN500]|eukprot:XP_020427503.1 hypothetical protein PPL_11446 [Heterostelium album PN500]
MDPLKTLFNLSGGYADTQILMAISQLDIANHIALGNSKSYLELAKELSVNEEVLLYLLKNATGLEIFHELEESEGVFRHTPLSIALRDQEYRDFIMMKASIYSLRSWESLFSTLKSGNSDNKTLGFNSIWDFLNNNKEENEIFNRSMTTLTRRLGPTIVEKSNFMNFETVTDIGGGHGFLLQEVLRKNPHLKYGINFDIKNSGDGNTNEVTSTNVDKRYKTMVGNAITDEIPETDCYILKHVLHMFKDDVVIKILKKIGEKLKSNGSIFVYELYDEELKNQKSAMSHFYLHLMLVTGGVERSNKRWREVVQKAGLQIKEIEHIPNSVEMPVLAIIGCGPSGLVSCKSALESRLIPKVFERIVISVIPMIGQQRCVVNNKLIDLQKQLSSDNTPFIIISRNYADCVLAEKIHVVQHPITEIQGKTVWFANGESREIDHIVFANVYTYELPYLCEEVLRGLEYNPNDKLMPIVLHKSTIHPTLPNIGFVSWFSSAMFPIIELQVSWLALVFSEDLAPLTKEQIAEDKT